MFNNLPTTGVINFFMLQIYHTLVQPICTTRVRNKKKSEKTLFYLVTFLKKSNLIQSQLFQIDIKFVLRFFDAFLNADQLFMVFGQINLHLLLRQTHIARDIEVIVVVPNLFKTDTTAESFFYRAVTISVDDFVDMIVRQCVLSLVLIKALGGVNEKHIRGLATFFQHNDTHRYPS